MSQFPEEPLDLSAENGFGYYPAYPGLTLNNGRYEVIRKLGFGPRSSVWLAFDSEENEYSALKLLTVHATNQKTNELSALESIKKIRSSLPHLTDRFVAKSHQGDHQCIALSVLGPDVEIFRLTAPSKSLPIHTVQKIIAEVLEPLSRLHQSGIIHGAVRANNFLFYVPQGRENLKPLLQGLTPSSIERKVTVGAFEYPIVLSQTIPLYRPLKWNDDRQTINTYAAFYLNNVGSSHIVKKKPDWEMIRIDASLRPPEVILGSSFDTKVDIWMIGCATYELLTGSPLVPLETAEDDGEQLGWMIAMGGGSIGKTMAQKSKHRSEFFNDDGVFNGVIPETDLTALLEATGKFSERDLTEIVKFIKKCLTLDPAERPTADKLEGEPWLKSGFACSCGFCG